MKIIKLILCVLIGLGIVLGTYSLGLNDGFDIGIYQGIDMASKYIGENYECHKRGSNE